MLDSRPLARIADDQRGFGIADEVLELGERVGGVEGKVDGSGPDGREIKDQGRHRLLDLHRDAVARLDPARDQHVGEAARQGHQVGIANIVHGPASQWRLSFRW